MNNSIVISSDHAGFELKEELVLWLKDNAIQFEDLGPFSDSRVDYPDYAHLLAEKVGNNKDVIGVLICGSGNGINMAANKHKAIRSALCWNQKIAELARLHNDANVLALPGRFIEKNVAIECLKTFIETEFEGGRHANRVNKIAISLK